MDWDAFNNYMMTRLHYSRSTCEERIRKLKHIIKNNYDIDDIESCYCFFANKINNNSRPSALNHYIKALNSYYKYKQLDHHFDQYKENNKPVKIPTQQEIKIVLKSFNRTWKDRTIKTMTYLLINSGMRISEICSIRFDDIDWHRHSITITGKGNKTRVIPVKPYMLTGRTHPSIRNYINNTRRSTDKHFVFTWINGSMKPTMFRPYFKKIVRKAGVGWLHPHSLRHYYATMLLKNNVNVKIVQLILGHGNIKTTSRYLHMLDNDIYQAIDRVRFDDILFSFTNPIGEFVYGPGEVYSFFSLDVCQGGNVFV